MPPQVEQGSDFISIVVAENTRIHTQLLTDAMHTDRELQVVASASSSKELLAAIERVPVDVAVVSYNLDDQPGRGPELLREIHALRPQIKGVLLLDSSRPEDVLESFRAGAKGVFSKQERLESLCKCIHCVNEGQIWARSVELELALEALIRAPIVRTTNHKGLELLSTRERQVIEYLASGMTNREIAEALGLSPHTIKNYLFRIFDKLGVSSRTELLYLTMKQSPGNVGNGVPPKEDGLPSLLKAAQAGQAWAQLRLAEHHAQPNGNTADPVATYMWFLLCEQTVRDIHGKLELQKKNLFPALTPQQIAEAKSRAQAWLKEKQSDSVELAASKEDPATME